MVAQIVDNLTGQGSDLDAGRLNTGCIPGSNLGELVIHKGEKRVRRGHVGFK